MAYLGTPPQSGFITTAKQRVTSSTNNYVDLDHAISSIADVIVFVNFVKQDTTNLSLTTSTRITLGGTLVSSDIVEIHYLGKAVNTQTPNTGTVTLDMLSASGTKSSSTFLRGDNTFASASVTGISSSASSTAISIDSDNHVTLPSQPFFAANATSTNIPLTTQQTIQLNERVDTNGDLGSNTFTAPVTGKYYLGYHFYLTALDADHTAVDVKIVTSNKTYAVTYKPSVTFSADANFGATGSQICDMDAGDTATFVIYIAGGSAQTDVHGDSTASGMLIG